MSLTEKQELFAQHVASGATQAAAYRAAYDTDEMTDKSIWESASKVASNAKVTARIAELKAELAEKHLWTREMSVKALVAAYSIAKTQKQSSAMTAAVRELNNMHGFNAPLEIKGKLSLSRMTDDELARIAAGGH